MSQSAAKPSVLVIDMARTTHGGVERVMLNVLPLINQSWRAIFCDLVSNADYARLMREGGGEVLHLVPPPRRNYVGGKGTLRRPLLVVMKLPWLLRSRMRLRSWIRRNKPAIAYFTRLPVIRAFGSAVPRHVPCVYHAHGFSSSRDLRPAEVRILNRRFCRIIAVSEITRRQMVEAGVEAGKIEVVYNAVDAERIRDEAGKPGPDLPIRPGDDGAVIFAQVGVFNPNKGQDVSVDALARLPEGRRAVLWLCGDVGIGGDDAYGARLRQLVAERGLQDRVFFLGWRNDVPRVLARADVVLMPSTTYESFGMVLAEAMALAKPCIGTTRGGVPEVIADGQTGLICEPTPQTLSEAMNVLVASPEARVRMGIAGRERVERIFALPVQAEGIIGALIAAMEQQKGRHS